MPTKSKLTPVIESRTRRVIAYIADFKPNNFSRHRIMLRLSNGYIPVDGAAKERLEIFRGFGIGPRVYSVPYDYRVKLSSSGIPLALIVHGARELKWLPNVYSTWQEYRERAKR